jgi:hypothetical protein
MSLVDTMCVDTIHEVAYTLPGADLRSACGRFRNTAKETTTPVFRIYLEQVSIVEAESGFFCARLNSLVY